MDPKLPDATYKDETLRCFINKLGGGKNSVISKLLSVRPLSWVEAVRSLMTDDDDPSVYDRDTLNVFKNFIEKCVNYGLYPTGCEACLEDYELLSLLEFFYIVRNATDKSLKSSFTDCSIMMMNKFNDDGEKNQYFLLKSMIFASVCDNG